MTTFDACKPLHFMTIRNGGFGGMARSRRVSTMYHKSGIASYHFRVLLNNVVRFRGTH